MVRLVLTFAVAAAATILSSVPSASSSVNFDDYNPDDPYPMPSVRHSPYPKTPPVSSSQPTAPPTLPPTPPPTTVAPTTTPPPTTLVPTTKPPPATTLPTPTPIPTTPAPPLPSPTSSPTPAPAPVPTSACGVQQTNVDLYGDDITSLSNVWSADLCCDKCRATAGCQAYTLSAGEGICYLKTGMGFPRVKPGMISAVMPSTKACANTVWMRCGNGRSEGAAQCCSADSYCQPWDLDVYQCVPKPPNCPRQFTGVDFFGGDIGASDKAKSSGECCELCRQTSGCRAYTFVNNASPRPMCYLKAYPEKEVRNPSAVSGYRDA